MKMVGSVHGKLFHGRRVRVLADAIAPLLRPGWQVLDIGCGDGGLGALIAQRVDDLNVKGYDVLVRKDAAIPVSSFNGSRIPLEDYSADAVMMVDVLHHTDDPMVLLREAKRVARHAIVIKDHRRSRPLAHITLRFMDFVGNSPHGVSLPYNYWSSRRWRQAWDELGLRVEYYRTHLDLYPWPMSWAFEPGLHFLARLAPEPSP